MQGAYHILLVSFYCNIWLYSTICLMPSLQLRSDIFVNTFANKYPLIQLFNYDIRQNLALGVHDGNTCVVCRRFKRKNREFPR